MSTSALPDALRAWLDEETDGADALHGVCTQLAAEPGLAIAAVLDALREYRCDPERRTQATRTLRAALRLPAIPGPVCRRP